MHVEELPTKVEKAGFFDKSKNIVRCNHGSTLPRDKFEDLVTIYHPWMDRARTESHYPYVFSGPEYPPHLLGYMATASIYIGNCKKLVSEKGEMATRKSEKPH